MRCVLLRWRRQRGSGVQLPVNMAAPAISGTAEVGQALTCSTGSWTGTGVLTYAYQWLRDGAPIAGATSNTYTLLAADDLADISCRVTATDDNGSKAATAAPVSVTYAAPSATGALTDQTYTQGTGDKTVDASGDFSGAVGGTWSVTGAGATIDQSGLVTIPTDALLSGVVVTVTYTNSGGQASSAFQVTVQEASAESPTFDSATTTFDSTTMTFDRVS